MNLSNLPINHQSDNPNLQEPKKNEDGTYSIPTIVNGVTKVNCNAKSEQKYSDLIENHINKLRQTINECNKEKHGLSKKQRIILIGDSNIKDYVYNLKTFLSNNYELYSVVRPGSSTRELKVSAKEEVSHLSHNDLIVICSGFTDFELNEFSSTFQNITNFIKSNNHTNVILINVPFGYDSLNSSSSNSNISTLKRILKKLVKVFSTTASLKLTTTESYLLLMVMVYT